MFWIDISRVDETCPCCGEQHLDGDLDTMAEDCLRLTVNRLAREAGREPVVRAPASRDDVAFVEMELAGALALADDALSLVPEMEAILLPHLHAATRADDVYDAIGRADRVWRNSSFKAGTASRWEEAITLAIATGVVSVDKNIFVPKQFRTQLIEGMIRAGKYYTNEFFNTQVMPALVSSVEKALSGDPALAKVGFNTVRMVLDQRLKSVPYWKMVANAAASRSYHYGMLRAGSMSGKTRFVWASIVDHRTSPECILMDGREWTLDRGLAIMERVAKAEHPEDLKDITPWVKAEVIQNATIDDLANMGVIVPPIHPYCRSTIDIY